MLENQEKNNNESDILKIKLSHILEECDKHVLRIKYAKEKMHNFMPLNVEKYKSLNNEEIGYIDQFIFRFSKLQDSMGKRLFPLVLIIVGEDIEDMSFSDILNRLEKIKAIDSANDWKKLREIRNEISHEYSSEIYLVVEGINKFYLAAPYIVSIYSGIKKYLKKHI
ncbi:MAG: hypothetical protein ACP5NA_07725 [Candidatus Acidulodesulfobacterium sp.]